jgi:hypothetical protein
MCAAVISTTDLFRQRDFHPARRVPEKTAAYVGLFASIVDLNGWLEKQRTSRFAGRFADPSRRVVP